MPGSVPPPTSHVSRTAQRGHSFRAKSRTERAARLGAKQQNYTLWIPLTYSTATLNYVKQAQQGGINTYEYQASVPPALIKNPQALAGLPKSLPIALLTRIRAAGIISSSDVAALSAAFPHATSIPLGYAYQAANTYWVAPTSGLVINVSNNETEVGGILLPGRGHPDPAGSRRHVPRHFANRVGGRHRQQQCQQRDYDLGRHCADRCSRRGVRARGAGGNPVEPQAKPGGRPSTGGKRQ